MLNILTNLLLPIRCHICQKPSNNSLPLCALCKKNLPYLHNTCYQCALPLPENTPTTQCAKCLKKPPHFDRTIALFRYEESIIQLITSLKFNKDLVAAKLLGRLFIESLECSNGMLPDLIIPVPLHKKRLRKRGFNQALEIAKPIAKKFKIPMSRNHCIRKMNTPPQMDLPANERHKNVRNAFEIKKPIKVNHVVIMDDVITTGSTANELSRVLKKSGVKNISVWCCARTVYEK